MLKFAKTQWWSVSRLEGPRTILTVEIFHSHFSSLTLSILFFFNIDLILWLNFLLILSVECVCPNDREIMRSEG